MSAGPAGHSRARRRQVVYPIVATVVLVAALPIWWYAVTRQPDYNHSLWQMLGIGAVLVAGFIAAEIWPLRIEVGRDTVLITLSEIPVVIGLLVVPVHVVGLSALIAALLAFLVRRDAWQHIYINCAFVLFESAASAAVFVAFYELLGGGLGAKFLGLFVGIQIGVLLMAFVVGETHRLTARQEPVRRNLGRMVIVAAATTTFALTGYTLVRSGTYGAVLCGGLAIAMVVLYRTYASFLRQHQDLAGMYTFGRRVTAIGSEDTTWQGLLEMVREQLNAAVATLVLVEPVDGITFLVSTSEDGVAPPQLPPRSDELQEVAIRTGHASAGMHRTTDPDLLDAVEARGAQEVMVVSLASGDRVLGYLEVRDRLARWSTFGKDDLRQLESLGQQLASSIDNVRLVESLRHEAHHDAITGLLNWRGLHFRTEESIRAGKTPAVLLLQLGVLPEVNNAIGHDRGEQLLITAGERLVETLGPQTAVAHLESDRFGLLIETTPEDEVEELARTLLAVTGQSYQLEGVDIEPHARIGIAFVDPKEELPETAGTLLQRAEMALTAAQAADESMRSYWSGMGEVFRRRFQLVTQFRRAVDQGSITVQYQPKISLADRELVGVEALVRWTHPELGAVPPSEFVEAIEATGSIDLLLEHVLEIVLAQIKVWVDRGLRIAVAVNLSVRNLSAPDFPATVAAGLERHGVEASLLTLEITESSVMADPERYLPVLRQLHALGVNLSVDDFGTGYSSLAYLRRLPIDEIKIDKSFVQGMITDLGDLAIVRAIIDLGHSLGLRVVAEGVEEEAARDALKTLRCDDLQGFLVSRPQPIDKLESWMNSTMVRTRQPGGQQVLRLTVG
ncbi:EAL domain-containing protein [Nakamurella sp. YIM 132087]|uniref:EAL domain-containing protein n=1 Tax=Nakamurella alba TaxID=2665158 RepID=A0A7K1FNU3_9ACTN|nr:bifunctional diguanylate cyclase/phosphodiesterase [Nakamurella alba]MTD14454.1 EAL domain-containing protein [Nakamurella alba]